MTISFSGLDGAGKTTQIGLLLDYYKGIGAHTGSIYSFFKDIRYNRKKELINVYKELVSFDVIHMRFRLNSKRNAFLMRHLENKLPPQYTLSIAATIQGYCDYCDLRECVINPLLEDKKTILFDRYYYDELAFKYLYGCPGFLLNSLYYKTPEPDIGFYIRIEPDECMHRNRLRSDSDVSIYKVSTVISNLVSRFDNIAEHKNLITIDGTKKREDIAAEVLREISLLSN